MSHVAYRQSDAGELPTHDCTFVSLAFSEVASLSVTSVELVEAFPAEVSGLTFTPTDAE